MNRKTILKRIMMLVLCLLCAFPVTNAAAAAKPKLSAAKKTLTVGNTWNLSLKNNKKKVAWRTSKKSVVSLKKTANNTVKLYAKKAGKATITAKIGKKKYTCKVTVKDSPKLNKTSLTLTVGDTYDLKVSGTAKTAKWSVTKKSVASISKKSKYVYQIKAKAAGTAYVNVKISKKTYKCKVTVKAKKVTNPKLDKTSLTGYVGQVDPGRISLTGTESNAKWKVADRSIAEISVSPYRTYGAEVTGKSIAIRMKKAGTTTITAQVDGKTLKVSLNVKRLAVPKGDYDTGYMACLLGQTYKNGKVINPGFLYIAMGKNNNFRKVDWNRYNGETYEYEAFIKGEWAEVCYYDVESDFSVRRASDASKELYTVKLPGMKEEIALPLYRVWVE